MATFSAELDGEGRGWACTLRSLAPASCLRCWQAAFPLALLQRCLFHHIFDLACLLYTINILAPPSLYLSTIVFMGCWVFTVLSPDGAQLWHCLGKRITQLHMCYCPWLTPLFPPQDSIVSCEGRWESSSGCQRRAFLTETSLWSLTIWRSGV